MSRVVHALFVLVGGAGLVASAQADTTRINAVAAPTHVEIGSDCSETCDAILSGGCDLLCQFTGAGWSEFAAAQVTHTPLSVSLSTTVDLSVVGPRGFASGKSDAEFTFTLEGPTFYYATWNIFFPPADNNILPPGIPMTGVYIGTLDAGTYYVKSHVALTQKGIGSPTQSAGLSILLFPSMTDDCDSDGTPDWQEIVDGTQVDTNYNGIPDACESSPDLNGDGHVNLIDVSILLGAWGTSGPGDINLDGIVNEVDLAIMIGAWLP